MDFGDTGLSETGLRRLPVFRPPTKGHPKLAAKRRQVAILDQTNFICGMIQSVIFLFCWSPGQCRQSQSVFCSMPFLASIKTTIPCRRHPIHE